MKRIGILTAGGDTPPLNATIAGAVARANQHRLEVIGIIKPKLVHLYSLDRIPAISNLRQVPSQRLKEISQVLFKRTGVKGVVFS